MRVEKNGIHYESFAEVANAMGIKPVSKVTKDKEKLKGQQQKFTSRHRCRACHQEMTWIKGTNTMTCTNPTCKGLKFTKEDPETKEKKVWYETSFDTLDDLGSEIAENIFSAEA